MTKRLLVVNLFSLLIATCFAQQSQGQTSQMLPAQSSASQDSPAQERGKQSAGAQPASERKAQMTPASFPNEAQQSTSPAISVPSRTLGTSTPPDRLNLKGKLRYFAIESFRPGIYPVAAVYDGLTMASPPKAYPREWRQGFPGFARNYGDFMASWASVQGGKFVFASLVREDPRYYPSPSKNVFARTFNAVRYVVIDRADNGHPRPALANVAGSLAGGFVGNAYLPDPYANTSHGLSRSALAVTGFLTSNLADEFRPEIRKVAKKLHLPLIGK